MRYLQLAQYLDARFLFLAAEFSCAVELVVHVRVQLVEERQSRGQPQLPALSIRLHGEADSCRTEELVGGCQTKTTLFGPFSLT